MYLRCGHPLKDGCEIECHQLQGDNGLLPSYQSPDEQNTCASDLTLLWGKETRKQENRGASVCLSPPG